jgi:lysophospholipase L1-like esterase
MQTIEPSPTTLPPDRPPPAPRRAYPAGRAIAIVLLALLFAALLDADSLVASVSSERFGRARSIELALVKPFRWVSDSLGLNLPHRWLADVAGTNQPNLGTVPSDTSLNTGADVSSATTGTTPLLTPTPWIRVPRSKRTVPTKVVSAPRTPRLPTAAAPVTVWLAGDSMIGELANAFIGHVTGNAAVRAFEDMQIGTGLARPDVYNWPAAVAKELQQKQPPDVVVLTFGANDDQDMMAGSHYLVRATPAWQAEYAHRVALVMNEVAGSGRLLVWVEVPPVARPRLQQTDQIIDRILRQQAATHHGVLLVDPGRVVAPGGHFTQYLPAPGGQQVQVRDPDGVHVTPAGADRVLPLLLAAIRTQWVLP